MSKARMTKMERECMEEVHAYLDQCFLIVADVLGDDWTYKRAGELMQLSGSTVRNMHYHDDRYMPSSMTLWKIVRAIGYELHLEEDGKVTVRFTGASRRKAA